VSGVIADTSEWVEYLSGRPAPALDQALVAGLVTLPPIVVAELVSGAVRPSDRLAIADLLADLPVHETPLNHWIKVGDLRRELRKRGVAASTPDCHVAQCALDRDAVLLTRDRIFTKIAPLVGLRLG
jgi:predicted nucleic acid-binding protein